MLIYLLAAFSSLSLLRGKDDNYVVDIHSWGRKQQRWTMLIFPRRQSRIETAIEIDRDAWQE